MADFDPDAFLAEKPKTTDFDPETFLRTGEKLPAMGQLTDPTQVQPSAEERLRQKEAVGTRTAYRQRREKFSSENAEKGVPLDIDAELPAMQRARVSLDSNIDKQADLLSKQPGILGVRKSKDGRNIIARVEGDDGKTKDVLLHPLTSAISLGDVAGAAGPIGKAAGAAGLALATSGASLPLTAGVMGGGAALMEAASSGGSRMAAGQSLDPGELAVSAGKEGAINAALPLAGAGAKAVGRGALNLLGGKGATETATKAAAERLNLPLTGSMARDSQVLRDVERTGGTKAFDTMQEGALAKTKERAIGAPPSGVLSEADIAGRAQPIFAEAERSSQKGVNLALTDAERAAQSEIQSALDRGIVPTNRTTSEVGDFIREKVAGRAPDSKTTMLRQGAQERYGEANRLAEAEGITVAPTRVAELGKELDSDTHKALLEFAPGIKKIPALNAMLTDAPPMTVAQARELRSVVYEMAHSGGPPGEGGVPKRYLTKLYKALDDDLNAAIKSGSPEVQTAHQAADDFYKANIQPLQQSDVAKLFLETDAAGRMGGDEIVRRLFRNEGNLDALRAYRQVLGENSPEWKLLVRQGMETVLEDAGKRTSRIDAGILLKRLDSLGKTELADEIIGPAAKSLRGNAQLMARAQGVKLSEEEVADALLSTPGQAARLLQQAIDRETAHDLAYNSTVQKQLRDGVLTARTAGNPDDFVQRFVFGKTSSEADVRQAISQIAAKDPAAAEALRQRTLTTILNDAKAAITEPGKLSTEAMDVDKLLAFARGEQGSKARVILGKDGAQFLDDLANYAAANEKRQRVLFGGSKSSPEDVAGRGAAAALGHNISLARLAVDAAASIPRFALGKAADKSDAVRRYLVSGELPALGIKGQVARGLALAAPEAINARNEVLSEKP